MTQYEICDRIVELFNADLNTTMATAGLDPFATIKHAVPKENAEEKQCRVFSGNATDDDQTVTYQIFIQFTLYSTIDAEAYHGVLAPYLKEKLEPFEFELTDRSISTAPINSGETGGGNTSYVLCDLTLSGQLDDCY